MIVARCAGAARILDVGCWSGFLGRRLLALGATTVDGVEEDPSAAELAARDYREVWVADVETFDIPEGYCYDRIVCADVLEHTANPQAVLARLRPFLAPDGLLVVSVPNVAHWSLRMKLLLGRWEYTDRGLLDRTHVHFFTRKSAQCEIASAGYVVKEVAITPQLPLIRSPSLARRLARFWPDGFAFQFVITAASRP
jgi:2-polyprenyl-3-methyl-5-hydroxy-6-metoxy-1,4-benzoquinol methylase